jgi:hypothetical protein
MATFSRKSQPPGQVKRVNSWKLACRLELGIAGRSQGIRHSGRREVRLRRRIQKSQDLLDTGSRLRLVRHDDYLYFQTILTVCH